MYFFLCVKITEDINLHILQQKFVLFLSTLKSPAFQSSDGKKTFFYQINY